MVDKIETFEDLKKEINKLYNNKTKSESSECYAVVEFENGRKYAEFDKVDGNYMLSDSNMEIICQSENPQKIYNIIKAIKEATDDNK